MRNFYVWTGKVVMIGMVIAVGFGLAITNAFPHIVQEYQNESFMLVYWGLVAGVLMGSLLATIIFTGEKDQITPPVATQGLTPQAPTAQRSLREYILLDRLENLMTN